MRLTLTAAILLLLRGPVSDARIMSADVSSYEVLAKQADTILIVSVDSPSERTGEQTVFRGAPVDRVRTKFKVQAVLKGVHPSDTFEFLHFAYPKPKTNEVQFLVNEFGFIWFHHKHDQGLAFLKTTADGKLEPVSGQDDPEFSFVKLPADIEAQGKKNAQRTRHSIGRSGA